MTKQNADNAQQASSMSSETSIAAGKSTEAMARMSQLQTTEHGPGLAGEVNKLLKLAAMAAYSREEVASLSGEDWVKFLSNSCGPGVFSAEQGRMLAEGVYRVQPTTAADGQLLIEASLRWLQNHRAYGDV